MAIRRQEMNSVPNKDKEAEHHEPPRASTGRTHRAVMAFASAEAMILSESFMTKA
jgi:hypothetical protein